MLSRNLAVAALSVVACSCARPPLQSDPNFVPYQGTTVSDYSQVAGCLGNVDGATATSVHGWSWDPDAGRPYDRVIVVVGDRLISIGYGGGVRPDVASARPDVTSGTTGFVASGDFEGLVSVYGVQSDGVTICRLGSAAVRP